MADEAPEGGNTSGDTPPADEFQPITSQDELNRLVGDRVKRERERFKDYNDLKAKASKLDEIEQANLSELEKANGRVTSAETDRDEARAEATRLRVAVAHGISLEDADLFLTGKDEETLTAQAKRLVDREADRKKQGNYVPGEGTTPTRPDNELAAFSREFFGD